MNATTVSVPPATASTPSASTRVQGHSHGIAWRRLSRLERAGLVVAQCAAAGLLFALVQTCQEQVRKGEQLRAGQRQMSVGPSVSPGLPHVTTVAAAGTMPVTP